MSQLTVEELGELADCQRCGRPTYLRSNLPEELCTLPDGFTRANARHLVYVRCTKMIVCEGCRYDYYGAW